MTHPIQGIKGAKPRFGPTISQLLRAETASAQVALKRKRRRQAKLRKSAKAG